MKSPLCPNCARVVDFCDCAETVATQLEPTMADAALPAKSAHADDSSATGGPCGFEALLDEFLNQTICDRRNTYNIEKAARWARAYVRGVEAKALVAFIENVRDNFDCDSDAHKYSTHCRACNAADVIRRWKGEG